MGDYTLVWFGVIVALLILLGIGKLFRSFVPALLSLLVALPMSLFLGFTISALQCAGSYEPFCGAGVLIYVPLILVCGYAILLALYRTVVFTLIAGFVTGPTMVVFATQITEGHINQSLVSPNALIISSIITGGIALAIIIFLRRLPKQKLKNDFYEDDMPEYEDY